jgi:hypothetical protein
MSRKNIYDKWGNKVGEIDTQPSDPMIGYIIGFIVLGGGVLILVFAGLILAMEVSKNGWSNTAPWKKIVYIFLSATYFLAWLIGAGYAWVEPEVIPMALVYMLPCVINIISLIYVYRKSKNS